MLNKEKNKKILTEILSFLIPVALAAIAYFMNGIYPGGKYTVLTYDLRGQLLPLYGSFSERGTGFNNLFYSMSGGLGGNYFGTVSLYLSPFDLIYGVIPVRYLPDAIYFMILLKIGLCGLFCFLFLANNKKHSAGLITSLILSCCYALMSYNFIYSMSPMWYDAVMLLPLLALSLEKIVEGKRSFGFIVLMAFCIICDYYLAYMSVIALVIYFVFRLTEEGINFSGFCRRILNFFVHGLVAAGLSSFILVPVIADFSRGKLASDAESVHLIKNSLFDVLKMLLPQSFSDINSGTAPNIFCGITVLVFCLVWFLNKNNDKRSRITSLIIVFIYFISFIFGPVDRIWHGFRDPIGFPCRYSYTFVFFMICVASRGGASLQKLKDKYSAISLFCMLLFIYSFVELQLNGSFLISKVHTDYGYVLRAEYERNCDLIRTGFSGFNFEDHSRLEKNYNFTSCDGGLMGYNGLEMFSSSYNDAAIRFLYDLGVDAYNNHISAKGLTPPVADFLNVGYYLSFGIGNSDYYEDYLQYKNYYMYRNADALPLGILLPSAEESARRQFTPDPFENINVLISDASGINKDVFVDCTYEITGETDSNERIYITFTPEEDGHYWFYRSAPQYTDFDQNDPNVNYHQVLSFYQDDERIGDYGQFGYRYCADLGFLEKGTEYTFGLDSPYTASGELFLAYLDMDSLREMTGTVKGFEISRMGKDGIVLSGEVDKETDFVLSLPYEKGYRIFVNGERTDYSEYRNALLRIRLNAGTNTVRIGFLPPGFLAGVFISLIFTVIILLYFRTDLLNILRRIDKKYVFYILSFVIPTAVLAGTYISLGIYPNSGLTPLILDLRTEHLAFFNYFNNHSAGFNSLTYQTLGGLGGGTINSFQMYCSPLLFIVSLFDSTSVPCVLWWLIIIMIGLCGLSEFVYLKKGFVASASDHKALMISICYALMSCMVIYTIVPVWIWGGIFLPLIALGLDNVIDKKKCGPYVFSITFAVIFNYYMAYILIVFSVVYFLYRVLLLKLSLKQFFEKAFTCFACGIVSCLLSAFSWMPVLHDLMSGKASEERTVTFGLIRNPIKVLMQILPFRYDGLLKHSLPFVYCGLVPLFFIFVFFVSGKIKLREKLINLGILSVFFLCMTFGFLDIVWMFFAEPNGYPSRYSFVMSFFVLLIAIRGSELILLPRRRSTGIAIRLLTYVIVITELGINTHYLINAVNADVGPYSYHDEYENVSDTMNYLIAKYDLNEGSGRTVKNWRYTNNDGIMFGYSDLDYFSSCYNADVHEFLEKLGLNGQFHMIRSTGLTPAVASVLGVDSFIQYNAPLDEYFSYAGSVSNLDVYQNKMSLPEAFAVNAGLDEGLVPFNEDPFENINILMSDICGSPELFEILPLETNGNNLSVVPTAGRHLWMYASPVYGSSQDIHSDENGRGYYIYYSGTPVCEYANSVSPYCVDLGVGGGDRTYFTFDDGISFNGIYMASYDTDRASDYFKRLMEESAYDIKLSDKGFTFDIDISDDKDIMITLPYTKGYSVYVDGIKTQYRSYRDALVLIPAEAGAHNVTIKYCPPGLVCGIVISFVSLIVLLIAAIVFCSGKRNEES